MDNLKQEELAVFVGKVIGENQTMLVDKLLAENIVKYDDIVNFYKPYCSECGGEMIEVDDRFLKTTFFKCENCGVTDDSPDDKPAEIMEWWLCDEWMIEQLQKQGEPILKTDFGSWWGRTCSGQAILLDYVIEKIYDKI